MEKLAQSSKEEETSMLYSRCCWWMLLDGVPDSGFVASAILENVAACDWEKYIILLWVVFFRVINKNNVSHKHTILIELCDLALVNHHYLNTCWCWGRCSLCNSQEGAKPGDLCCVTCTLLDLVVDWRKKGKTCFTSKYQNNSLFNREWINLEH